MDERLWGKIEEIYHSALALPADQRATFLAGACGNDVELLREVQQLLEEDNAPTALIDTPAWDRAALLQSTQVEAGTRLGPYRITGALGAGAMGSVYRAEDTRLRRTVAIKLLRPSAAGSAAMQQRFEREAKAISSLNHPHICALYDVGSHDGAGYLVMEYVEGETLAARLAKGALPFANALAIACQVADALGAAQDKGIVHRDLKPENIMLTASGPKVLDFGVAKTISGPVAGDDLETKEQTLTVEGMIVGTLAYMSPEQVEGKSIDSRSDVFSFGSVLYEMVTGRRAFHREGKIETMSAVLHEEPAPVREVVPAVPATLEQIVSRCLRKDPNRRFQHMADLKVALEEVRDEAVTSVARKNRSRAVWAASMAITAGSIALAVWLAISRLPPPDAALKALPLTSEPGYEENASVSPDGNQVAYSWNGPKQDNFDIYVKLIGLPSQLRLTTRPERDSNPAWSPDGRSLAFLRELPQGRAALITISILGGPERRLAECYLPRLPYMNPSPAWSPDGKWLVISDKKSPQAPFSLVLVSVSTGDKQTLTAPPASAIGDSDAAVSSDGHFVVFVRTGSFLSSDLYLLTLSTDPKPKGDPKRLTSDNRVTSHPTWTAEGRDVIYSSGTPGVASLWRIPVFGNATPRRLAYAGDEAITPSVARQGYRLVYSHSIFDPNIWRLSLHGSGGITGLPVSLVASTRIEAHPAYSPDGKRIAFESCRSGSHEIWVCDRDGSNAVKLTSFGAPIVALPRWSPDGQHLAFDSNAAGPYDVYVVDVNGGQPRRMTDDPADDQAPNWSNDGRWIYFASYRSGESQIWKMPASGGAPVRVTKGGGHFPSESPDGKFLYYGKNGGLWRASLAGGDESPVLDSIYAQSFSVSGQGVYFVKGPQASASVNFLRFSTGTVATVYRIPKPAFFGLSISPDGGSILYTQIDQQGADLMLVENFR